DAEHVDPEPLVVADPLAALHAADERLLHQILNAGGQLVEEESLDHVVVALEQGLAARGVACAPALEQGPVAGGGVRRITVACLHGARWYRSTHNRAMSRAWTKRASTARHATSSTRSRMRSPTSTPTTSRCRRATACSGSTSAMARGS